MNKKSLLSLVVGAALLASVLGYTMTKPDATSSRPPVAESTQPTATAAPDATHDHDHDNGQTEQSAEAPVDPNKKLASELTYTNASLPTDPLGERTLGDPNAPVRIEEFSSLSCPHCAHFHRDTFADLKEQYIDTGKVFFVFTDFPLNLQALEATMIARCLPPEQFFTFVAYLYETQEKWAFGGDYKNILRQNAKLAGMSDEKFDSCLANTALKEGIAKRVEERAAKHNIKSTPSFVINNGNAVSGALSIEQIAKEIENAQKAPSPADEPASNEPAAGQ